MDDGDDTYSAGPAKDIQAIDKASVHRICSGQVVLNLATAVKELVENSIDAGGNNIEIRLKEYGSELLEVIDNGEGVEEANVKGLTLKHHTSKLKDFTDLVNVDTFGFRGEALSSLCALGKMCITTCHKSAKIGTKIEYDNNGKIVKKSPCSRQVGTTVSVEQLFSTLPVRHKEFQRNIKKEFSKMGQVLNAYCIISTGVKIVCTNQTGKGNKNTIVKTSGNTTMRGNLTNVFGSKPVQSLIDFKQLQPGEETCSQFGVKGVEAESSIFRIQGFISTCEHGKGRSSTDRQFYFINKRPCDLTKVSKVVNEAYHMYNRHQYPFVVLDISLNKDAVDVNVTPDKRMVFMQNEKLLLATLKHSLLQMFEPLASQYQMSNLGNQTSIVQFTKSPVKKHSSCPGTTSKRPSVLENLKRSFSSAFAKEDDTSFTSPSQGSQKNTPASKQRKLDSFVSERRSPLSPAIKSETSFSIEILSPTRETIPQSPGADKTFSSSQTSGVSSEGNVTDRSVDVTEHVTDSGNSQSSVGSLAITVIPSPVKTSLKGSTISWESSKANQSEDAVTESDMGVDERFIDNVERRSSEADASELPYHSSGSTSEALTTIAEYDTPVNTSDRRERVVSFSLQRLKERFVCRQRNKDEQVLYRNFRAQINPGDNQAAEEELKKEIRKDMFPNMEILGQFNLGFIIVKLGADLFIVDQHATDEKYNFEVLQRSEVLKSQKLIIPRTLELTPMNETILLDNVDIFKTNGFDFIVNDEAPCGQRAKLSSLPMYRNWIFSEQDIEELIFMLTDCPGIMCRPSRVRQMFASRACRTSVMIGTALNKSEMRKLINHMGEIEHPWNCPHGRPTMRHLINLNMIKD